MADATTGPCLICQKVDANRCGQCLGTFYCSKQCQKTDWPIHKLVCTALKNFDMSRRPSDEHVRAIRFPVDKDKNEIFWLYCERRNHGDEEEPIILQYPETQDLLQESKAYQALTHVQFNAVLGRHLADSVCLSFRDTFLVDVSLANRSVERITSTKPVGPNSYWRGHMTAYGTEGPEFEAPPCRDTDMTDFRHLADHLISHGPWTGDVRINYLGDQNMFDRPRFEPIKVDHPSDPVFCQDQGEASAFAKLVGMSIFARRFLPSTEDWAVMYLTSDQSSRDLLRNMVCSNKPAAFLHLVLDHPPPTQTVQGVQQSSTAVEDAGQRWAGLVRSVLVVRQDKQPLSALQVEALSDYCEPEVTLLLARKDKTQARALVTQQAF